VSHWQGGIWHLTTFGWQNCSGMLLHADTLLWLVSFAISLWLWLCWWQHTVLEAGKSRIQQPNKWCTHFMDVLFGAFSSKDPHMPTYPLRVVVNSHHNHPLFAADALRHRDVGPEAAEKIAKLLHLKHSPSASLEILKYDLQDEHPDDYFTYSGDRYHCPDLQWCYRCSFFEILWILRGTLNMTHALTYLTCTMALTCVSRESL